VEDFGMFPTAQIISQHDPIGGRAADGIAATGFQRVNIAKTFIASCDEKGTRGCHRYLHFRLSYLFTTIEGCDTPLQAVTPTTL
jgi:hypothetical protein